MKIFINEEYGFRYYVLYTNFTMEQFNRWWKHHRKHKTFSCARTERVLGRLGTLIETEWDIDEMWACGGVWFHLHNSDDSGWRSSGGGMGCYCYGMR